MVVPHSPDNNCTNCGVKAKEKDFKNREKYSKTLARPTVQSATFSVRHGGLAAVSVRWEENRERSKRLQSAEESRSTYSSFARALQRLI